jgi:hypothetical protein
VISLHPLCLNEPNFVIDQECFWIGDLRGSERPIWLQILMHAGDLRIAIVIDDELRSGARLKTIFGALPFINGKVHLNLLAQVSNARTPRIIAEVEPLPDFF